MDYCLKEISKLGCMRSGIFADTLLTMAIISKPSLFSCEALGENAMSLLAVSMISAFGWAEVYGLHIYTIEDVQDDAEPQPTIANLRV